MSINIKFQWWKCKKSVYFSLNPLFNNTEMFSCVKICEAAKPVMAPFPGIWGKIDCMHRTNTWLVQLKNFEVMKADIWNGVLIKESMLPAGADTLEKHSHMHAGECTCNTCVWMSMCLCVCVHVSHNNVKPVNFCSDGGVCEPGYARVCAFA